MGQSNTAYFSLRFKLMLVKPRSRLVSTTTKKKPLKFFVLKNLNVEQLKRNKGKRHIKVSNAESKEKVIGKWNDSPGAKQNFVNNVLHTHVVI